MAISITMPTLPRKADNALPRSQAERLWLLGGGVSAFVLLLIGYFLFISPQRSHTAQVNSQVATARQQDASLQARIDTLREQSKNLAKYEAELKAAQLALPSTSGVSDFVRSLQSLGNATQTNVNNLTVGQPSDVSAVAAAAPAANPATPASTAGQPAGASPGTPNAATGPTIYGLAITAQVSGSPAALGKFLEQLQAVQPRAVLITQISEGTATTAAARGAAASSSTITLSLAMQAFVAPTSPAENAQLAQQAAGK